MSAPLWLGVKRYQTPLNALGPPALQDTSASSVAEGAKGVSPYENPKISVAVAQVSLPGGGKNSIEMSKVPAGWVEL